MEKRENPLARKGADVAKWIKAVDCESTTRGFNPRRSPINKWTICYGDTRQT